MAIKDGKIKGDKIQIDLSAPEGNAFMLIGQANSFGKQLGMTKEEIHKILDEMRSGDYEHLIKVFDANFGSIVDLYRGN
jgi:ERCC4-related helicase